MEEDSELCDREDEDDQERRDERELDGRLPFLARRAGTERERRRGAAAPLRLLRAVYGISSVTFVRIV